MTTHLPMVVLFGLIPALSAMGCTPKQRLAESSDSNSGPKYELVIGEGGGFTGQYAGFSVSMDGMLSAWRGRFAEDRPQQVRQLAEDERLAVWQILIDNAFFDMDLNEIANYAVFIRFRSADDAHEITWMPDEANAEKRVAQDLYQAILRLLEDA